MNTSTLKNSKETSFSQLHTSAYLELLGVPVLPPLTSPFDPGYDPVTVESHLDQSAPLISALKFSMASWLIARESATRKKAAAARRRGIPTVTGSGPFEVAVARGKLASYLDLCADIGISRIECAEFTDLKQSPRSIVKMANDRDLEVQFELGTRHAGGLEEEAVAALIEHGNRWLEAGAVQLVLGARGSSQGAGLFDLEGNFKAGYADRFASTFGLGIVSFEAPDGPSQSAMLDHFGRDVQLCGIRLEELLGVEIYRRGLHWDASGKDRLRPASPGEETATE